VPKSVRRVIRQATSAPTPSRSRAIHIVVKWNASSAFEPDTIAAHAAVLKAHAYVWWGKVSKTGKLGINKAIVTALKRQIADGTATHLYLYCPDTPRPTLHVGLVEEIHTSPPNEMDQTPRYYSTITYPVPFWFKLSDIREVALEHLQYLTTTTGRPYDPGGVST